MALFKSNNPLLNRLENSNTVDFVTTECSYTGVGIKTAVLIIIAIISASFAAAMFFSEETLELIVGATIFASIGAFVCVMIAFFFPRIAMPFALGYSICEGLLLGCVSAIVEYYYPGLSLMALIITFTIFGVNLFLYTSRIIRVGRFFRKFMMTSMLTLLLFVLIVAISGLFTDALTHAFYSDGPLAILLCVVFIIFGALMLIFDFDRVENFVESRADKKYEWSLALSLMVSIVWIYFEVLRLLLILYNKKK